MVAAEEDRALKTALAVYLVIFALKLGVYFASGVMALFAEALHTLSDIFVSAFLLIAAIYSRRKADQQHMFGYGRAQNVAALVAAVLFISFTSFKLVEESLPRLFSPQAADFRNLPLAIGVLVLSMLLAVIPLVKLARQKERGPAAKAQLLESINDELGLAAALAGTLFVAMGVPIADPIASLLVAGIIAYNGVKLFRENMSYLLGRSPGEAALEEIRQTALAVPGVLAVRELRAEYIGPETLHAGMRLVVAPGTTIEAANVIAEQARQRIHQATPAGYCEIQVEPALEEEMVETAAEATATPA